MSRFTRPWRLSALVLTMLVSAGCATLYDGPDAPRVSLASIRVQEIRGFETSFEVDLRVLNRGDAPLVIEGLDCELTLGGRQLAEGVANPSVEIAPYDSGLVSVTVYSSMLDMVGIARRIIRAVNKGAANEPIAYEISGHLMSGGPAFSGKFPFASQGEIDLNELAGDF